MLICRQTMRWPKILLMSKSVNKRYVTDNKNRTTNDSPSWWYFEKDKSKYLRQSILPSALVICSRKTLGVLVGWGWNTFLQFFCFCHFSFFASSNSKKSDLFLVPTDTLHHPVPTFLILHLQNQADPSNTVHMALNSQHNPSSTGFQVT